MAEISFLAQQEVLLLHEIVIYSYGGHAGVRDLGLLDSALSQAHAQFSGNFLHPDIASMAAAYFFHLLKNHPFLDGNKRTAALSAIVFLSRNGCVMSFTNDELVGLALEVATSDLSKEEVIHIFHRALQD